MKTEITWVRDMLRGDDAFELRLKLLKQVPEEYPYKDDEQQALFWKACIAIRSEDAILNAKKHVIQIFGLHNISVLLELDLGQLVTNYYATFLCDYWRSNIIIATCIKTNSVFD